MIEWAVVNTRVCILYSCGYVGFNSHEASNVHVQNWSVSPKFHVITSCELHRAGTIGTGPNATPAAHTRSHAQALS